jgi:hypothetical protein
MSSKEKSNTKKQTHKTKKKKKKKRTGFTTYLSIITEC